MRVQKWHAALAALGALGSLVVHQLAYLFAFPVGAERARALGDHGHLGLQWSVVTPLAVVAAVVFVLHQVRQLAAARPGDLWPAGGGPTSGRRLAVATAGLFLAQELIEAVVHRHHGPAPWANPALYVGLALAPLVATAVSRFLARATRVAARWLLRAVPAARPRPRPIPAPLALAIVALRTEGPSPRGPPWFVFT